jgi:rSAM/selenodomain-associated transferase 2
MRAALAIAPYPELSIIIPTLDEAKHIGATLEAVRTLKGRIETIVADGGSSDATAEVAGKNGARVLHSDRGRGAQMHGGSCVARGDVLWFLHADTIPPPDAPAKILEVMRDPAVVGGNFGLDFDGESRAARALTFLYPHFRKLGLCYGDSGIFVRRETYVKLGGFKPYPIFEDLDLVRRLKLEGRFVHLDSRLTTSARRFEGRSFGLTFARWTALQTLYWAGVSPCVLGKWYKPIREANRKSS